MKFTVAGALLDACVLGALANAPAYGYDLTQKIQRTIEISESTLYPVLRRLLREGLLDSYDKPFDGRNRRYYQITDSGRQALRGYTEDWQAYRQAIENILNGGNHSDQE